MAFAPIFIVGVPRSGTTLLRVLLDSHSQILALPETPWLLGAYGSDVSLRELLLGLTDGPYGAVRNVAGLESHHILAAGRGFLEQIFEPVLEARNKTALVFKTPADIRNLEYLTGLLPDALYIHITRDGRDVAMSQMAKKGSFFNDLREYRRVSYANVFKRWVEWEQHVRAVLYRDNRRVVRLHYEDLIANPEHEMRRVMEFLGLPFESAMLDYAAHDHDYPAWEAGSTDVSQRDAVSTTSVGKWRNEKMTTEMLHTLTRHDDFLVGLGYPSSNLSPGLWDRARMAGFPAAKLVVETLSGIRKGWLRPVIGDRVRAFAFTILLLLAAHFLVPAQFLRHLRLASDAYQPILCFAVTFGFAAAFVPALVRRFAMDHGQALFLAGAMMLAYIGALECAQYFTPDRHAALKDFLFNASGVIVALAASIPFSAKGQRRAHSA